MLPDNLAPAYFSDEAYILAAAVQVNVHPIYLESILPHLFIIPVKAGIHFIPQHYKFQAVIWIPACANMTCNR